MSTIEITKDSIPWEAFATAFTGILAVGSAVWVGLKQTNIASRQTKILESQVAQKELELKIALFDRRFRTWTTINDSINGRVSEIVQENPDQQLWPKSENLTELWRASLEFRLLFPQPVDLKLAEIRTALTALAQHKAAMARPTPGDKESHDIFMQNYNAYEQQRQKLEALQEDLANLTGQQMALTAP